MRSCYVQEVHQLHQVITSSIGWHKLTRSPTFWLPSRCYSYFLAVIAQSWEDLRKERSINFKPQNIIGCKLYNLNWINLCSYFSPKISQNYPLECNVNNKSCHVSDAHPALPAAEQETTRVTCICLTALWDAAATADARVTHFSTRRKKQDTEKNA